jgi:hypothetical protein
MMPDMSSRFLFAMALTFLLPRAVVTEGSRGVAVATNTQESAEPALDALRAKAQERMRQDRSTFSVPELQEIETTYQRANRDLRSPQSRETLQQLVQKYPKSNRAGCGVLYLAQMSSGSEREQYLKTAIETHSDAWYGDGAQVGALARLQLASVYANSGRLDEARTLAAEIRKMFPGAVDHNGNRLTEILRRMKLE